MAAKTNSFFSSLHLLFLDKIYKTACTGTWHLLRLFFFAFFLRESGRMSMWCEGEAQPSNYSMLLHREAITVTNQSIFVRAYIILWPVGDRERGVTSWDAKFDFFV